MTTNTERLDYASAGTTRRTRRPGAEIQIEEIIYTQTDDEIRGEFEAAAKRQPTYGQTQQTDSDRLNYSSAGATRRR